MDFRNLSDGDLEIKLKETVLTENKIKIEILHLLAEVERRRLYSKDHPSLYEYCIGVLKYSGSAAQRRIDTMRLMKLIPEVESKIVSGELNLTSVAQAQTFFRHEAKAGKSYNIEQKKDILQKLENKSTRDCTLELVAISPESVPQEKRRILTLEKTELKIVLSHELVAKLDRIKSIMSHSQANLTDAELLEKMADLVLQKLDPEQKALRAVARSEKKPSLPAPVVVLQDSSRYIPNHIKHAVYLRDKGTCTHANCKSKHRLQYDHIQPYSRGGKTTVENLRLLCRVHNQWAAIEKLGYAKMRKYLG